MSRGHKNPETTAKPRTKALAGMSAELVPWFGYALQPCPPAQLPALGKCYFPELGRGERLASLCFSILTVSQTLLVSYTPLNKLEMYIEI